MGKQAPPAVKKTKTQPSSKAVKKGPSVLPVTLLSGFLGSGKTSLLRHVLHHRHGLRVAVILNEISEINIDVLALNGSHILKSDEKVVEMSNGCICCTLRDDLLKTLRSLHKQNAFDAVLIESSGIAEPMQVAETFFVDLADGNGQLMSKAPLHNCVTVVDASTLKGYLNDPRATMAIDAKAKNEREDQSIGELLIQQIEFANVVVLNKVDVLTGESTLAAATGPAHSAAIGELTGLIRSMNPTAEIVPAVHCSIPVREILTTARFSEDWARGVAGWMEDIESGITHTPETLEYGIGSYLYTADRPFHPQRVHDWIDGLFFWNEFAFAEAEPSVSDEEDEEEAEEAQPSEEGASTSPHGVTSSPSTPHGDDHQSRSVGLDIAPLNADGFQEFGAKEKSIRDATYGNFFRSKGFVWLGNPKRLDHVMEWSQAGTVLNLQYSSPWETFATQARGQRLVFIGQGIKKDVLQHDLDALLLTNDEWEKMQSGAYNESPLPDPFEPFPVAPEHSSAHDDHHHVHSASCSHSSKKQKKRPRE